MQISASIRSIPTLTQPGFSCKPPQCPAAHAACQEPCRAFGMEGVGDRGRDYYLEGIDGLLFGDSPNEGYVRGTEFLHPVLGIRSRCPTASASTTRRTRCSPPGPGDLAVRFDGVTDKTASPCQIHRQRLGNRAGSESSIRETRVNGLPAATARAKADQWDFDITVIRFKDRIYRFLTAAAPTGSDRLEPTASAVRNAGFSSMSDHGDQAAPTPAYPYRHHGSGRHGGFAGRTDERCRTQDGAVSGFSTQSRPGSSLSAGEKVKIVTDR
jgi:predicted Zn-dependent protease